MRSIDKITEGQREALLLARLRARSIDVDDIDAFTLPFFTKIQIQTTTLCNAACTTCPYPVTSKEFEMGWMPESVFDTVVDQIAGRGVERVSLFLMNEPTVDRRLESFSSLLRDRVPEAKVTIITNGKLLDGVRVLSLQAAGMGEITISVNGFTQESYGSTMIGLRFDRILKNLEEIGALRREGRLENLDIRITALEIGDARERAADFAERVGIPVFLKPVSNRAGSVDTTRFGVPVPDLVRDRRSICQRPFVKAYVLFNGDMLLCNCDWRRTTIFGNVNDTTLEQMWSGPALTEIRRHHLRESFSKGSPCESCDYPYLVEE